MKQAGSRCRNFPGPLGGAACPHFTFVALTLSGCAECESWQAASLCGLAGALQTRAKPVRKAAPGGSHGWQTAWLREANATPRQTWILLRARPGRPGSDQGALFQVCPGRSNRRLPVRQPKRGTISRRYPKIMIDYRHRRRIKSYNKPCLCRMRPADRSRWCLDRKRSCQGSKQRHRVARTESTNARNVTSSPGELKCCAIGQDE